MTRRKLVFFAAKDPQIDPGPIWSAYHFGLVAHGAGLDAEVRLAGGAVGALRADGLPEGAEGDRVRDKMDEAVENGLFVSG